MSSLFRVNAGRQREGRNAWDRIAELFADRPPMRVYAGEPVTDETSMRLSAVWGCIDLLSEIVSTMPVDEYRKDAAGTPRPIGSMFLEDPAGDGTGFEVWARQVMTSALTRGNAFGLITSVDNSMWPRTIEVLHPDRVDAKRAKNFGPVEWLLDDKPIERWPAGPLWHMPAYVIPGSPVGMSPIRYAAQSIGLGLAAQKFGAQWFADGMHPVSTVNTDQPVTDEQAKIIKQRIATVMAGGREPLVLGNGLTLNPIAVPPEESQFLETMRANADDIARYFFRRPPGEGGQVTYANVEARSLDLLTYTINGWLVRLERSLTRLRPRPRYVKFNADSLLRVDTATRYKAHDMAVRGGWKSRDEVRQDEDMPPIPDGSGSDFLWPPYSTAPEPAAPDTPTTTSEGTNAA